MFAYTVVCVMMFAVNEADVMTCRRLPTNWLIKFRKSQQQMDLLQRFEDSLEDSEKASHRQEAPGKKMSKKNKKTKEQEARLLAAADGSNAKQPIIESINDEFLEPDMAYAEQHDEDDTKWSGSVPNVLKNFIDTLMPYGVDPNPLTR
eukprot:SAG22_NODE_9721_length_573_cov_1.227848_1_plen_148_part_00